MSQQQREYPDFHPKDDDEIPSPTPSPRAVPPPTKPLKWRTTPAAQRAADAGMGKASRKLQTPEGQKFKADAEAAILSVAKAKPFFRVDDVRAALSCSEDDKTFYGSALGTLLKAAAQSGVMVHADHRPSGRTPTHGRPVTLWQSKIYVGP